MIFVSDEKEHEQARKVFEELYASDNLENMFNNFGIEGTYRILLNIHSFSPISIRELMAQYALRIKYKPKKRKFSFQYMRRMKIGDHIPRQAVDVLKDEIIKNVYKDIIRDRKFLDKLHIESRNSKNNRFIREAYAQAYTYYSDADQTTFEWINTRNIQLKLFQKIGIKFIMHAKKAIIADMAGLGKTIQAVIAALNIRNGKGAKKVLIIAPMRSVNRVWKHEIETKTLGGQTVAVVNNESMNSEKQIEHMKKARFVVTNYEAIRGAGNKLRKQLLELDFDFIIIDEAHRIRNETLQTDAIREFDAEYKVILTATPLVGRRISKVFNLLHWLDPATYCEKKIFMRAYSGTAQKIRQLNIDLKQIFLRRLKENVSDLPPKRYIDIRYPLNPEERRVYDMIAQNFLQWLTKYSLDNKPSRSKFIKKFNKLRQAAVAAHLVEDCIIFDDGANSVTRISHRARTVTLDSHGYTLVREKTRGLKGLKDEKGNVYPLAWEGAHKTISIGKKTYKVVFTHTDIPSARYQEIDKIVEEKIKKGEKVVLFTNYRDVIHALEKRYRQYGVCYIMGNMTARSSDNEIEAFQSDPAQRIFLATYPTGGESISLTAANNVIEVDKPITQKDRYQSNNRPDRWGQTKIINVYRLTAINTVDEDIEKILRAGDVIFRLAFDEDPSVSDITDELIEEVLKQLKYSITTVQQILSYKRSLKPEIKKDNVVGDEMSKGKETIRFSKGSLFARLSKKDGSSISVNSPQSLLKAMENLSSESKELIKEFCQQEFSREIEEKKPIKDTFFWLLCTGIMPELMHVDFDRKLEMYMEMAVSISSLLTVHKTVSVEDLLVCVSNKELILETLFFMDKNNIFQLLSFIGFVDKQYYYNGALLFYEHPFQLTFSNDEITYVDWSMVNAIAPDRLIKEVSYNPDEPYESRANQYRKLTHIEEIRLARAAAKGNHAAQSVLAESCLPYIIDRTKGIVYQASVKSNIAFILEHIDKNELYADLYVAGEYECIINLPGFYQECVYMRLEQYMERYLPAAINQELFKHMTQALREKNILDEPAFDGESEERIVDTIAQPLIGTRVYRKFEGGLLEKTAAYLLKKDMTQDELDVFSMYLEGLNIDEISEKMHFTERQIGDIVLRIKSLLQEPGSPVREAHMRRMMQADREKQRSN